MTDPAIEAAHAFLRSHTTADLRFDEHLREIKYVIDSDGLIVAPVMVAMLESVDTVLFVPQWSDDSMELMVTLMPFTERDSERAAGADRWRIYHGEPEDVRWAAMTIDSVRFEGMVIDGEPLVRPNPLVGDEPRLCKLMNQHHAAALKTIATQRANIDLEEPVMIGIDPLGFDLRARFDVIRIAFDAPAPTPPQAEQQLLAMVGSR